jgi:hypothetical protein
MGVEVSVLSDRLRLFKLWWVLQMLMAGGTVFGETMRVRHLQPNNSRFMEGAYRFWNDAGCLCSAARVGHGHRGVCRSLGKGRTHYWLFADRSVRATFV